MMFLWQGECFDMGYSGCNPQCCALHTLWPWELPSDWDTDMHHFCTLSFRLQLTPCEYILAHVTVSFLPLQSGGCWWKPMHAASLEETPQSDMAFCPGWCQTTGRKNSWKQFELSSACITKERVMRTEDIPKPWLKLLSHAQLRINNCQAKTEVEGPPGLSLGVQQLADFCF